MTLVRHTNTVRHVGITRLASSKLIPVVAKHIPVATSSSECRYISLHNAYNIHVADARGRATQHNRLRGSQFIQVVLSSSPIFAPIRLWGQACNVVRTCNMSAIHANDVSVVIMHCGRCLHHDRDICQGRSRECYLAV